jgi:hypothetical protein
MGACTFAAALTTFPGCEKKPIGQRGAPSTSASGPATRPSVGRINIDPDFANLLPKTRPGFQACSEDFGPRITIQQGRERYAAFLATRRAAPLHTISGTNVRRASDQLVLTGAGASARVTLGEEAETARKALDELERAGEELETMRHLFAAIFPPGALVASASTATSTSSGRHQHALRVYLVSDSAQEVERVVMTDGQAALRALACSQEELSAHRSEWRAWPSDVAAARRIELIASIWADDYGWDARIDLRISGDVVGGTLVIACLGEGDGCTKIAATVSRKRL